MNIFKTLIRGNSRKEEFISASFSIILSEIPEFTSFLIEKLFDIKIDTDNFEVVIEETFSNGRIDIEIKSLILDIYIENKVSTGLGDKQLERYSEYVKNISNKTRLVLLSQYFIDDDSLKFVDEHVFWSEIYSLIEVFKNSDDYKKVENGKKNYLINQFLNFLKEENMSDEKVSWEYSKGVGSFLNLLNMNRSVLDELKKEKIIHKYGTIAIGNNYAGIYVKNDNNADDFWIGIHYGNINELNFSIQDGLIDKYGDDKFKNLRRNSYNNPGFFYNFNETYFFAFSKEEQKQAIYDFVKDCLAEIIE